MKHCAKKLLGLAFALALCLAVGGTALAQTPEQEVLAYEQNVTTAAGTNIIDKLATEGYQVTIPTTVTVKSGEDKETLMVTADVRQMRTLTITLDSANNWQLKHESGQVQAGYSLTSEGGGYSDGENMWYQEEDTTGGKKKLKLHLSVGQKAQGDFDVNWKDRFTIPLTVAVDPSQATMSGTYSDTVSFAFAFTHKSCVTYFINVYEQELQLTNSGAHVQAVNMVNADGTVKPDAKPVRTEIWEYPVGNDVDHEWSYGGNESDAELRWEKATATMNTARDETAGKLDANKNVTINLNLVRKRYWLDVNGATDYTNEYANGNQGNKIAGFVNMQVSADNGTTWSDWFWQEPGDDYWGQFPYGIRFRLGLHHVKNGYVYDTGTNGGVKIIANKQEIETEPGKKEGDTTYYVYEGTLTGEPTGKDSSNNVRYCYIPCYKKGLTYMANEGTGGKEDVNGANKPRTNVLYQEGDALESPEQLKIAPPSTDMVFAGWSTKSTYTTGDTLYQVGEAVAPGAWENYTDQTDLDKRPQLNGARDTQKRELYAIWGYKTTIKIAFENQFGSTDKNALGVFETVQKRGVNNEQTLETEKIVIPGQTLTLDLNDTDVTAAITAATDAVNKKTGDAATDGKIWDLAQTYTITVPQNKTATLRFEILRKRYLLNVMAVLSTSGNTVALPADAAEAAKYGTFHVKSNGSYQTAGGESKASVYQWLRNYGGSYEVCEVEANTGYQFVEFMIPAGKGLTSAGTSTYIKDTLTGKNENLSYFGGDGKTYTGDTIYVVFKEDVVTFDFNGGKNQEGETKTEVQYDPDSFIPVMYLRKDGSTSSPIGWSLNKEETQGEVIYHSRDTQLKDIPWLDSTDKVLYARWSTGPNRAPAKKALTVHYHANFDPNEELALDLDPNPLLEDMDEDFGFAPDPLPEDVLDPTVEAVKIVTYKPDENVVLRNCMFKRAGYVFVGWNTEPDGTGKKYEVNGVPITDWAAGTTVDLYAQWKKPEHLKPVVDSEPFVPADPDTPPERIDDGFDAAFGADPDPLPEGMDDAFGVDPDPLPEGMDDAFGADPDPLPEGMDDAFGIDPDPLPEGLDDAFGV